jgi:TPR repeat protein
MKKTIEMALSILAIITTQAQSSKQLYRAFDSLYNQKKYTETIIPLTKAAQMGYAKAQNTLGLLYFTGVGVQKKRSYCMEMV